MLLFPCRPLPGNSNIRMEDRKSTRLNSSHLGISYAALCLKKKKPMRLLGQLLVAATAMPAANTGCESHNQLSPDPHASEADYKPLRVAQKVVELLPVAHGA